MLAGWKTRPTFRRPVVDGLPVRDINAFQHYSSICWRVGKPALHFAGSRERSPSSKYLFLPTKQPPDCSGAQLCPATKNSLPIGSITAGLLERVAARDDGRTSQDAPRLAIQGNRQRCRDQQVVVLTRSGRRTPAQ